MHIVRTRKFLHWLTPLAIVGSLSIFAATFMAYASAHADHRTAGFAPAIIGLLFFACLMTCISYLSLPGPGSLARLFTAIGIAILEGAVFFFFLLLLLLNTFGS